MKLILEKSAILKSAPEPAAKLREETYPFPILQLDLGTELEIVDFWTDPETDHVLVQLANPIEPGQPLRWFVYKPFVKFEGMRKETDGPVEETKRKPHTAKRGKLVWMPGITTHQVGANDLIVKGGNFKWYEATKNMTRIPVDANVTIRIVKMAKAMQRIRAHFDNNPITITSWYRDPVSNRAVGGASRSAHLSGYAVDFLVKGVDPVDVYKDMTKWWEGGLGVHFGFTHADLAEKRRWKYGSNSPNIPLW